MKYIIILVIVLGVILGGMTLIAPKTMEYVAPSVVEKTVEVNPLDEQIKAREAELTEKYEKIKKTQARIDVLKAERARLDSEIVSLQKDLAGFITSTSTRN